MAIDYWHDMSILVGGLEVATHGKNVDMRTQVAPLDITPLSTPDGWTELAGGLRSGTFDMSLMQNLAAGSIDATMFAELGVSGTPVTVCTRSADGSFAYLFRNSTASYTPSMSPVGDLAMAALSGNSTGGIVRGSLIHPGSASRSSSSTGTGRQLGAVVAGKSMYAALHVLSVSGTSTPTLTVIVQSDDNAGFTTPTTRISFTAATAVGAQWGSVAGALTDDYWRISYTISGTNPVFAFAVSAGVL